MVSLERSVVISLFEQKLVLVAAGQRPGRPERRLRGRAARAHGACGARWGVERGPGQIRKNRDIQWCAICNGPMVQSTI
mgnify:CR=1 FL=1